MVSKHAAGPVSKSERRMVNSMARASAPFERKSVEAATKLGFRLMRSVLYAYRRGDPTILDRVIKHFDLMVPELRDAMLMSYLTGLQIQAPPVSLSVHKQALAILRKRLEIPLDQLRELSTKFEGQAIQVLQGASDVTETKLQETLFELTKEGEHVREGVKGLRESFDNLGITPVNSFQVETIFRTQTQMAYSAGQWQTLQDPDIQEILWGYKYSTVGDDRVRDEHIGLEGVLLPKEDPFWETHWPPNGWACRCKAIPIYDPRDVVHPKPVEIDGKTIQPGPDKGFAYHPGKMFEGVVVPKKPFLTASPQR